MISSSNLSTYIYIYIYIYIVSHTARSATYYQLHIIFKSKLLSCHVIVLYTLVSKRTVNIFRFCSARSGPPAYRSSANSVGMLCKGCRIQLHFLFFIFLFFYLENGQIFFFFFFFKIGSYLKRMYI